MEKFTVVSEKFGAVLVKTFDEMKAVKFDTIEKAQAYANMLYKANDGEYNYKAVKAGFGYNNTGLT